MTQALFFVISAFATFRLSLMFAKETGPCRIFERFRALFTEGGCWHKGVTCVLCETVWWAGLITAWLVAISVVPWQLSLIYWLGMSGLSVIFYEYGPKLD